MARRDKRYWLLKSEPGAFSFDDLWAAKGRTTCWDGVRNYQARNLLRDELQPGDGILYYHSNAEPTGVVGIAEVASKPYPDPTQFERGHEHFDATAERAAPRWFSVDVKALRKLPRVVTLAELKAHAALANMVVAQRGSRLSVQPVTRVEFECVLALAAPNDVAGR